MSRFTELLVLVRDFKKNTDKLLQELGSFDNQFASRESEITTMGNQLSVLKIQKQEMEDHAKTIISKAETEAQKIRENALKEVEVARSVTMQAAKDKEDADRVMSQAKSERLKVDFERADFERQVAAFNDKRNRLQEVLK